MGEGRDRALVEKLLAGDEGAFSSLVSSHNGALLRLARSFVPSQAVAEEVVQETWLEVLKGLSRFEGRSSLKTWIFKILANRARTRGVREKRSLPFSALAGDDPEGSDDGSFDPTEFISDGHWAPGHRYWTGENPEIALGQKRLAAAIRQAIDELPPNLRSVILLRDVEGWSSEEACEALELSEANQRVLLHRARARVRKSLWRLFPTKGAAHG